MGNEFVMVPRVPTEEMIVAFAEAWYSKRQTIDDPDMLDAYAAMLAVAPEHQGEPVALPARKDPTQQWHAVGGVAKAEGWNACLDEIAKLGPLYTHADPGEVERLESLLRASRTSLDNCALQIENLQAQLANKQTMSDNYCALLMDANQKLAERDALLAIAKPYMRGGFGTVCGAWQERYEALSASAEPSAPNDWVTRVEGCYAVSTQEVGYRMPGAPADQAEETPTNPIRYKEKDGKKRYYLSYPGFKNAAWDFTIIDSDCSLKMVDSGTVMIELVPRGKEVPGYRAKGYPKVFSTVSPLDFSASTAVDTVGVERDELARELYDLGRIPLTWPDHFREQLMVVLHLIAGVERKS